MKKIILVSEYFAPRNEIGSVRMSKIIKMINKDNEFEVLVITAQYEGLDDTNLAKDVEGKARIVKIPQSRIIKSIDKLIMGRNDRKKNVTIKKLNRSNDSSSDIKFLKKIIELKVKIKSEFVNTLYYSLEVVRAYTFVLKAKKYLANENLNSFSYLITTYGPMSPHILGNYIKKEVPKIKWIADYRDPVLNIFTPKIYLKFSKKFASKFTKNADVITVVSNGYSNSLFLPNQKKIHVISNGFDTEDLNHIDSEFINHKKLILTYTGELYSGKRDLSVIFKAIKELENEKKISSKDLLINYAGRSLKTLVNQAEKYELENLIVDYGFLTRSKSLSLQASSDLLLLSIWNTHNGTGNIPGKFLDYMLFKKPIICICSGDLSNSEIKNHITEGDLGFCFEEGKYDTDYNDLKQKILFYYKIKFNENKLIEQSRNELYIEKFNYINLANKFKSLLIE